MALHRHKYDNRSSHKTKPCCNDKLLETTLQPYMGANTTIEAVTKHHLVAKNMILPMSVAHSSYYDLLQSILALLYKNKNKQ